MDVPGSDGQARARTDGQGGGEARGASAEVVTPNDLSRELRSLPPLCDPKASLMGTAGKVGP